MKNICMALIFLSFTNALFGAAFSPQAVESTRQRGKEDRAFIDGVRRGIEITRLILNTAPTENTRIALEFLERLQHNITQDSATPIWVLQSTALSELNSFDEKFKALEIPHWQEAYIFLYYTILEEVKKTLNKVELPKIQAAGITPPQEATSPQAIAQSEVLIKIPEAIAAQTMPTVDLNLDERETFTTLSFRELIDDEGAGKKTLVLAFSQDAKGRWFPYFFNDEEMANFTGTNPLTRAPIAYRIPITIRKVGDRYEQEQ